MEKQLTAMREFIEWLRDRTWGFEEPCESGRAEIDPIEIYDKATELISKEKEQIELAYFNGTEREFIQEPLSPQEYFIQTYNNQ